jgi:hypothetical protein
MKLPSDLAGLIVARYRATGRRDVLREVAVACERVRDRFEALGISNPNRGALLDATVERMSSLLAQTENVFNEYKTTTAKPVWFENVFAAESHLLSILTEYVNRGEEIRLDWLGMTMRNVWNALPTLLTKLDQRHPKAVHFRTAMISSDWLRTNRINASWTDVSADHEYEAILDFFAQKTAVGKANWTNEIRRYSHMPTVHGGLINDSYLLMGICQWDDNGNLWAGDKPYELFSVGDANRGTERIGIFKGWFDTCWRSAANPTLLRWRPLDDRSSSTTRDVLSFLASLGVASCRPCTLRGPALRDHASRSAVALSSSSPGLPPSPSYP